MTKPWTPGPWFGPVETGEGEWAVDDRGGYFVAGCVNKKADARLIAAAPELAELLQRFVYLADGLTTGPGSPLSTEASALLSRIRGES